MTFITTPDIFSKDTEIQDVEAAQFVRLQLVPLGPAELGITLQGTVRPYPTKREKVGKNVSSLDGYRFYPSFILIYSDGYR